MNIRYATETLSSARVRPLSALLLALLVTPGMLLAQDDDFSLDEPSESATDPALIAELTEIRNYVEIGAAYVDDDSFYFGRYSGLRRQGGYGVLNIDWFERGAYNDPDAFYWRVTGRNLGFDSRDLAIEVGRQGTYRVRVEYDQTPSYRSDSAATIFRGAGGNQLTLPSGWVAGGNTTAMSQLLPSLVPVNIGQERRRIGVGIDRSFSEHWSFSSSARHERKDGLRTIGAVIGNSGGNPRAAILPEPVDYETRTFEVAANYTKRKLQFQARYYLSLFDNANASLSWQNPFAAINGWNASAGYPDGFGRIALPPDNRFHQVSALGAYNLSDRTRISADVALGHMRQNDAFLPYTINPNLAASITQPLPRNSLDGQIDTRSANLRITSRPNHRFNWSGNYRLDERDNETPRNEYVYIGGDSQTQDTGVTSSRRRFNEPASYSEHRLRFDAGYRVAQRTRLTGHVERREIDRTYSEREEARETTFGALLNHSIGERFNTGLRLTHARRSGSTYHGNEPFLSGYSPGYTNTVAGGWENAPGLRKPHLADRDRDRVALLASFSPNEAWQIGFDIGRSRDDYDRSDLGLQSARLSAYTMDVTWTPLQQLSAYGFYTRESMDFEQIGVSVRGGANREIDLLDPNRRWNAMHNDDIDTAGLGLNWHSDGRRWKIGGDLSESRSRGAIVVTTGSALSSAPLPLLRTRLRTASLHADFAFNDRISLRARLLNESYRSNDWSLDGIGADQLANVILLGENSPNYRINALMLSATYRF